MAMANNEKGPMETDDDARACGAANGGIGPRGERHLARDVGGSRTGTIAPPGPAIDAQSGASEAVPMGWHNGGCGNGDGGGGGGLGEVGAAAAAGEGGCREGGGGMDVDNAWKGSKLVLDRNHNGMGSNRVQGNSAESLTGGGVAEGGPTLDAMDSRFVNFCEQFLEDKVLQARGLELFRLTKDMMTPSGGFHANNPEDIERMWRACVLLVVKKANLQAGSIIDKTANASGFTLMQLLQRSKITLIDFLREIAHFLSKAAPILRCLYPQNGADIERSLQIREIKESFVQMAVLFNHYRKEFYEQFLVDDGMSMDFGELSCAGTLVYDGSKKGGDVYRCGNVHLAFGWILFLFLKTHIHPSYIDLVTSTNLLLCVLTILMLHMPLSLRRCSLDDIKKFPERGADGVDILASFCATHYACVEDVSGLMQTVNIKISEALGRPCTPAAHLQGVDRLEGIKRDGLFYFEALMDNNVVEANLKAFERAYEVWYYAVGEVDERIVLNGDGGSLGNPASLTPSIGMKRGLSQGTSSNNSLMQSPSSLMPASPLPSLPNSPYSSPVKLCPQGPAMPPPTPVSMAMNTARWLRQYVSNCPMEPTGELLLYFRGAGEDVSADIHYRAQVLLERVFLAAASPEPHWRSAGMPNLASKTWSAVMVDGVWAEQRRQEALKLYYRILLSMLKAESTRLKTNNLSALLANEIFHRTLLACCSEVVLSSHKTVTVTFPGVLEPTGITAFDLNKVVEAFVRHEDALPKELKRHLNSIEERVLESIAWEKGSSLYNVLGIAKPLQSEDILRLQLLAGPTPSLDMLRIPNSRVLIPTPCPVPDLSSTEQQVAGTANTCGVNDPLPPASAVSGNHVSRPSEAASVTRCLVDALPISSGPPSALPPLEPSSPEPSSRSNAGPSTSTTLSMEQAGNDVSAAEREANGGVANGEGAPGDGGGSVVSTAPLVSHVKEHASAFQTFCSPIKSRMVIGHPPLQSAFASPQRSSCTGNGETNAGTVVGMFFQKVLKLAGMRIAMLCNMLRLSGHVAEQVKKVVEHTLNNLTKLFYQRHLDQIILSSIYGVAKVVKLNTPFKEIISQYRKLPHCKPHVFRNVLIEHATPKKPAEIGDIIKFYNEVYVPATKSFLLTLHPAQPSATPQATAVPYPANEVNGEGTAARGGRVDGSNVVNGALTRIVKTDNNNSDAGSPSVGSQPLGSRTPGSPFTRCASPLSPAKKVAGQHNVWVSSLCSQKAEAFIHSPRTRRLYAFVGEGTLEYQSPSRDLLAINSRINSGRRLGKLNFEDGNGGAEFGLEALKGERTADGMPRDCAASSLGGQQQQVTQQQQQQQQMQETTLPQYNSYGGMVKGMASIPADDPNQAAGWPQFFAQPPPSSPHKKARLDQE